MYWYCQADTFYSLKFLLFIILISYCQNHDNKLEYFSGFQNNVTYQYRDVLLFIIIIIMITNDLLILQLIFFKLCVLLFALIVPSITITHKTYIITILILKYPYLVCYLSFVLRKIWIIYQGQNMQLNICFVPCMITDDDKDLLPMMGLSIHIQINVVYDENKSAIPDTIDRMKQFLFNKLKE